MVLIAYWGIAARAVAVLGLLFRLVDDVSRYNTRWNSNDGVTQQHDEGREQATDRRHRRDVAIAHRCHRDDGPIDRCGQVGELRTRLSALHHEHQGSQAGHQYQHKEELDRYLGQTLLERVHQQIALIDEAEQLEYAEDTDKAERTQEDHVARVGQEK